MTTRALTDLLGIDRPIVLGPFGGLSSVALTAAVSSWMIADTARLVVGPAEAQDIVASHGIVFPAIASSTKKAVKVFEETGLPTKPFTQHLEDKSTFFFPLTYFGADVAAIPYKVFTQMIKHPLTQAGLDGFMKDWAKRAGASPETPSSEAGTNPQTGDVTQQGGSKQ